MQYEGFLNQHLSKILLMAQNRDHLWKHKDQQYIKAIG